MVDRTDTTTTYVPPETRYVPPEETVDRPVRRIFWGAIFAGTVIALVVQLILSLLGLAIGLTTVNPTTEAHPFAGLGIGGVIWMVISGIIALFAGGWAAGRLAGVTRRIDAALHGAVTWGFATLVGIFLVTSALGTVLGGAIGALGKTASLAGAQGGEGRMQQVAEAISTGDMKKLNPAVMAIREEAHQMAGTSEEGAQTRGAAPQKGQLDQALDQLFSYQPGQQPSPAARQKVVSLLTQSGNVTPAEANTAVNRWIQQNNQVQEKSRQIAARGPQMEENAANIGAATAFGIFIALVLGAAAAIFGGVLGVPHYRPEHRIG